MHGRTGGYFFEDDIVDRKAVGTCGRIGKFEGNASVGAVIVLEKNYGVDKFVRIGGVYGLYGIEAVGVVGVGQHAHLHIRIGSAIIVCHLERDLQGGEGVNGGVNRRQQTETGRRSSSGVVGVKGQDLTVVVVIPKLVHINIIIPESVVFENIPAVGDGSVAVFSLAFEMQLNVFEIRGVGQVAFTDGAIVDGIGKAGSERPVSRYGKAVGGRCGDKGVAAIPAHKVIVPVAICIQGADAVFVVTAHALGYSCVTRVGIGVNIIVNAPFVCK